MSRLKLAAVLPQLTDRAKRSVIQPVQWQMLTARVAWEYVSQGTCLPLNHQWRVGKLIDSGRALQDLHLLALGHGIDEELLPSLELIAFGADIGRLIATSEKVPQIEHGRVSANCIDTIAFGLQLDTSDAWFRSLMEAVTNHSAIKTPAEAEFVEGGYLPCLFLRDLDKLGGFGKGRAYAEDLAEIARQLIANKLTEEALVPESVIASFEKGEMIDRTTVKIYSGFLVQFLAWFFDLNFEEIHELAFKTGAAKASLGYIERNVPAEQWQRIHAAAVRHGITS